MRSLLESGEAGWQGYGGFLERVVLELDRFSEVILALNYKC